MMQQTLVIDFDSTLITVESLDELAHLALASQSNRAHVMGRLEELCAQAMAGELAFDESLRRRLQLFRADRRHVEQIAVDLPSMVSPSALGVRDWLHAHREHIYVISGGFAECILPVTEMLGLDGDKVFANHFAYDEEGVVCGYDRESLLSQPQGKVKQILSLKLTGPVIVIGDGYTDYEMKAFGVADQFWAFTETISRPSVIAKADDVLSDFYEVRSLVDNLDEDRLRKPVVVDGSSSATPTWRE
ncbi:MAG TPA: HAD-IB family phosphatase [Patescibacteria group bacterium]|nr:HAD-IB family phosphatase [Patescibacteria group bacterium]